MNVLIAFGEDRFAEGLLSASRQVAAAAGWDLRAVRLGEGGPAAGVDLLDGIDVLELGRATVERLVDLIGELQPGCVALGLRAGGRPELAKLVEELLAASPVPLLFVRPGMRSPAGLTRLLVPLEGTPSSSAAMRFAEDVFCRPGREIVMVNVATGAVLPEAGSMGAPRFIDQEQYEWADWRGEFSRRFSRGECGRAHRIVVLVGEPAAAIVGEAAAREADLIVMSWRGTFTEGRGETARGLLRGAPCPVLVVSPAAFDAANAAAPPGRA